MTLPPYPAAVVKYDGRVVVERSHQQREQAFRSRVLLPYSKQFNADGFEETHADLTREQIAEEVFGPTGWTIAHTLQTRSPSDFPVLGYLLTHPTDGIIVWHPRLRVSDGKPGFTPPTGGPFRMGGLRWSRSAVDFILDYATCRSETTNRHPTRIITRYFVGALFSSMSDADQQGLLMLDALGNNELVSLLFRAFCEQTDRIYGARAGFDGEGHGTDTDLDRLIDMMPTLLQDPDAPTSVTP